MAAALGAVTAPVPAHARPTGTGEGVAAGRYVALGDSYAAGAGIPAQSAGLCLRSDRDYGRVVAAALAPAGYTDRSCAGAKVGALTLPQTDAGAVVNGPQLDAVAPDVSLVTVTIGGNDLGTSDLGFVDVVATCASLAVTDPLGAPCRAHYGNSLSGRLESAASRLAGALRLVHAKAPRARVLVVGYPSVVPDDPAKCLGRLPITTGDVAFLRSVLGELNDRVADAAETGHATYVDTLNPTRGHDGCSAEPWVEGLLPTAPALPLHPNATGERVMATAVLNALGR
ncbi:SGNH/GDSL hydrolase family protein [Streptomyces sp. SAJ15]|uniref:SGNH/GDSL hydrolase family protein n=1 Tax=Streptomyces sp. SAJ15 TaxID=2011095 RepID=UPI0021B18283|nr:SGNH/GDSL hydrolase family protein [Streptomyces sp. SAJ15]